MARTICRNDRCDMIAVNTSVLTAIVLGKADADACIAILEAEPTVLISAGVGQHLRVLDNQFKLA